MLNKPWRTVRETHRGHYKVFDVHEYQREAPSTGHQHSFYVVESGDWINVLPLTEDGQIVFVRQYRHGTQRFTLEIPGGMVDPEDASPAVAAERELLEETGYAAREIVDLGYVEPNPAIQNNRCHTFLAVGAHRVAEQNLDGAEEMDVLLVQPDEVPRLIASQEISHALVVSAFYRYDLWRKAQR